jgi:hypothetical protein
VAQGIFCTVGNVLWMPSRETIDGERGAEVDERMYANWDYKMISWSVFICISNVENLTRGCYRYLAFYSK